MRQILLLIITTLYLNADYLYKTDNVCVYDIHEQYLGNGDLNGYCYFLSASGIKECNHKATIDYFVDNYTYYPDQGCISNIVDTNTTDQNQTDTNETTNDDTTSNTIYQCTLEDYDFSGIKASDLGLVPCDFVFLIALSAIMIAQIVSINFFR